MPNMWWTPKAEKLGKREWSYIRDGWLTHIPPEPIAGQAPPLSVDKLQPLRTLLGGLQQNKPETVDPVDGLKRAVLLEGIYLIHKSANAIAGAQIHIGEGLCSWSLASAISIGFLLDESDSAPIGLRCGRGGQVLYGRRMADTGTAEFEGLASAANPRGR